MDDEQKEKLIQATRQVTAEMWDIYCNADSHVLNCMPRLIEAVDKLAKIVHELTTD